MDKLLIFVWKVMFVSLIVLLFVNIVSVNLKIPY